MGKKILVQLFLMFTIMVKRVKCVIELRERWNESGTLKGKDRKKSEEKNMYEQAMVIQEEQGLKVMAAAFTGRRIERTSHDTIKSGVGRRSV